MSWVYFWTGGGFYSLALRGLSAADNQRRRNPNQEGNESGRVETQSIQFGFFSFTTFENKMAVNDSSLGNCRLRGVEVTVSSAT